MGGMPGQIGVLMSTVDSLFNAYKQIRVAEAREITKRTAIRKQAEVAIAQLHEETVRYCETIRSNEQIMMRMIQFMENLIAEREMLNEYAYQLCTQIIAGIFEKGLVWR